MNWVDIAIVVIIIVGGFAGFVQGLIRQVIITVGLIAGAVLAGHYYQSVSDLFAFVGSEVGADVLAFVLIFLATIIVAGLVARALRGVAALAMLGCMDQVLGMAFGVVVAVLGIQLVLLALVHFITAEDIEFIRGSVLAPVFLDYSRAVLALLPGEFASWFEQIPKP